MKPIKSSLFLYRLLGSTIGYNNFFYNSYQLYHKNDYLDLRVAYDNSTIFTCSLLCNGYADDKIHWTIFFENNLSQMGLSLFYCITTGYFSAGSILIHVYWFISILSQIFITADFGEKQLLLIFLLGGRLNS